MKIAIALAGGLTAALLSLSAQAACTGSGSFQHCYDAQSGNSYNIQRYGNRTHISGSNPRTGSTWSQNSTTYGNTTHHRGIDSSGDTWSSTTHDYGNSYGNNYGSGGSLTGRGISNCGIAGC